MAGFPIPVRQIINGFFEGFSQEDRRRDLWTEHEGKIQAVIRSSMPKALASKGRIWTERSQPYKPLENYPSTTVNYLNDDGDVWILVGPSHTGLCLEVLCIIATAEGKLHRNWFTTIGYLPAVIEEALAWVNSVFSPEK